MPKLVWSCVVLLLLLRAHPARADALASDVYADVKDVIAELIEREVAESVTADLSCYSPSGFLKYFPNTLQSLYERNFGAIKDQLRREAVGFASNYAFECFRQQRTIPLDQFLPVSGFDPTDGKTNKCNQAVKDVGGPANYQGRLAREFRATGRAYYPLDRCGKDQSAADPLASAICPFVAALRAAASARPKDGVVAFAEAAAGVVQQQWSARLKLEDKTGLLAIEPMQTTIFDELLTRVSTGSFPANGLLTAFATDGTAAALDLALQEYGAIFGAPSERRRVRAGALRLLLDPAPPEVLVFGTRLSGVRAVLRANSQALSPPTEPPGIALVRAILAQAGKVFQGTVQVDMVDAGLKLTQIKAEGAAAVVGPGLTRLLELAEMGREATRLEKLLDGLGLVSEGLSADDQTSLALIKLIVQATIGLVQSIEETAAALKAIPRNADGTIDVITLLDAIIRPDRDTGFCPVSPVPAGAAPEIKLTLCGLLRQTVAIADPEGLLLPILGAALERDYRRVAVTATDAVFSNASIETMCCGKTARCFEVAALYGRLAKSIVSYVLMPRGDEDQSIAARAVFKSAAVDVIREIGKRGGVDRPWWGSGFYTPTLSLRASWSSSYQLSDPGRDSIRYVPTVDFPTLRFRVTPQGSSAYVGVAFNVLEPLGLLAEVVSRDESQVYFDKGVVAASVIHPRVSGVVAFPSLTKNLALVVSGGMRGAAPFKLGEAADGDKLFGYSTIFGTKRTRDAGLDGWELLWPLLEVSAGVQYLL